jgi:hypothetical protein
LRRKNLTKKWTANEKSSRNRLSKIKLESNEITKEMATVSIENKSKVPGYGGIYWQYFEDQIK